MQRLAIRPDIADVFGICRGDQPRPSRGTSKSFCTVVTSGPYSREFELPGDEAIMHRDGDRPVIEPVRKRGLLALLKSMNPIEDRLPGNRRSRAGAGERVSPPTCWTPTSISDLTRNPQGKASEADRQKRARTASAPQKSARNDCSRPSKTCSARSACCRSMYLPTPNVVASARSWKRPASRVGGNDLPDRGPRLCDRRHDRHRQYRRVQAARPRPEGGKLAGLRRQSDERENGAPEEI